VVGLLCLCNRNDHYMNEELESERKKWEFRYNNMKETIKGLEDTVKKQRETIRELKSNKFVIPTGVHPQSKIRGL